jgi:tryptophan-rich sensory protein
MKIKDLPLLIFCIALCLGAGVIGSVFTFQAIPTWYQTLAKPFFSPPNWIFGPVWTTLYILMGIALYLVWQRTFRNKKLRPLIYVFLFHLLINAGWSIIFFGFQSLGGALITIILLWCLIGWLTVRFYQVQKMAGYLLVPYIAWVSFATLLNFSVWQLNR